MKNEFKRRSIKTPTEIKYSIKREHSFKDGLFLRHTGHIDDFFIVSQISKRKKSNFFKELYQCEELDKIPSFKTSDDEDLYLKQQDSHIKDFIKKYLHDLKECKEYNNKNKLRRLSSHSGLKSSIKASNTNLHEYNHISPKKRLRKISFDHYLKRNTKDIKHNKKKKDESEKGCINKSDLPSQEFKDKIKKVHKNVLSKNEKLIKKMNNQELLLVNSPNLKSIEPSKDTNTISLLIKNNNSIFLEQKNDCHRMKNNESSSLFNFLENDSEV